MVPDEPITVTLSRNGWIRSRQGHGLDAPQFAWKAGDSASRSSKRAPSVRSWCSIRGPRLHDPRGRHSRRPRRRRAGHHADRAAAGREGRAGDLRDRRAEVPRRGKRRLRLRRDVRRHGVAAHAGKAFMTLERRRGAACRRWRWRRDSITSRRCRRAAGCWCFRSPKCARCRAVAASSSSGSTTTRNSWRSALTPGNASSCRARIASAGPRCKLDGDELAKYLLRRARKGALVPKRLKVTGFGRES